MRRIHILYLITDLDVGGAEKSLCQLVLNLDRRRFSAQVASLTGRGALGSMLEEHGISVTYLGLTRLNFFAPLYQLVSLLRRERIDVLHSFLFHANLVGRLAGWLAGTPRVISSVRVAEPRLHHLWLDRLTQPLCHVETCVAEAVREYTHRRAGVPLHKLVTIPNAIAISEYEHISPALPPGVIIPPGGRVVLTIGRLEEQKDPMTFLRAAQMVHAQQPEIYFIWAGEGPLMEQTRRLAKELGLESAVYLVGHVPDVKPLLAACDLFVLSSRWEGMPNALLEAMASAKPAVVTKVGGCPELVRHGETGLLVPPQDPHRLAEGILALLADPANSRRMGKNARARVASEFTIRGMVERNERLYVL